MQIRGSGIGLILVLILQAASGGFFVFDILVSVLGLTVTPINWALYELIEIAATVGLILGTVLTFILLRQSLGRAKVAEQKISELSGAFMDMVLARFADWELTPAESDVALFVVKGMTTAEIADLRGTSEGTIKAQTNGIYRKAGISSRSQLVSLLIDDLIERD